MCHYHLQTAAVHWRRCDRCRLLSFRLTQARLKGRAHGTHKDREAKQHILALSEILPEQNFIIFFYLDTLLNPVQHKKASNVSLKPVQLWREACNNTSASFFFLFPLTICHDINHIVHFPAKNGSRKGSGIYTTIFDILVIEGRK